MENLVWHGLLRDATASASQGTEMFPRKRPSIVNIRTTAVVDDGIFLQDLRSQDSKKYLNNQGKADSQRFSCDAVQILFSIHILSSYSEYARIKSDLFRFNHF